MKTNNVVALSLLAVLLSGCNDAAKQEPVNPVSQTETAAPSTHHRNRWWILPTTRAMRWIGVASTKAWFLALTVKASKPLCS